MASFDSVGVQILLLSGLSMRWPLTSGTSSASKMLLKRHSLDQMGKPPLACPRATYTASGCKPDQYGFCRGLLFCMEYLEENLDEWFGEELEVCKL